MQNKIQAIANMKLAKIKIVKNENIYIYLNTLMHCVAVRYLNIAQNRANMVFF